MTTVGLLLALNSAAGLAPQLAAGSLADKYGRKVLMAVSLLCSSISLLGLGLAHSLPAFAAMALLYGITGWPLYGPASNAMVADLVEQGRRTQAYGLIRVVHNFGIVIGPSAGGFIIAYGSYLWLFTLSAALSLVFFAVTLLALRETRPQFAVAIADPHHGPQPGFGLILRDNAFLAFCATTMLLTVVYAQLTTTFPVYLRDERHIAENLWGLVMALNAAMVVLFQFPLTSLTDRYRRTVILATGSLFYAVGFGALGWPTEFAYFALLVAVLTVGEMLIVPTANAFVADIAPEAMRGRYMGVFGLVWAMGYGLGPVTGGLIMDRLGGFYIWPATLVLCALAAVVFLAMGRAVDQRMQPENFSERS